MGHKRRSLKKNYLKLNYQSLYLSIRLMIKSLQQLSEAVFSTVKTTALDLEH